MSAPASVAADVKTALDRFISRFEFQEAALLINIPQVPFELLEQEVASHRGYFAYPPSSLLYLGACFRELGVPREIVDLNYVVLRATQDGAKDLHPIWQARIRELIGRHKRPLVCVSFMFEATFPAFQLVTKFIRSEFPGLCLATGGVNATADPDLLLNKGLVDVVFCNEGEQVLGEFYRYLRTGTGALPVNMVFRDEEGAIHRTPLVSGGPVDVDIRPEYDLIPTGDYHKAGCLSNFSRMNGLEVPFGTVLAKRGCRAFCAFCGVRNFNGKGVRNRGVESVVDEMVLLRDRFKIEHFDWLDDDLLSDRKETLKLFRSMKERLPGITWAANNGLIATAIDDEVYRAMRDSGCIGFKVGLESGNPEMLKRIHKPANVKQFLNYSKLAQNYLDIFVSVNFILSLPEERFEQMLDSMLVAVQSRLHWHNFYIYQHLKNTEFYIAYGGLGDGFISKEHGKDSQSPIFETFKAGMGKDALSRSINPVRSGAFQASAEGGVPSGYEVFNIDKGFIPPRPWVREIWFTFNTITNFLLNPCLKEPPGTRLTLMIRWLDVLGGAYPNDALMASLQYYLMRKSGDHTSAQLTAKRDHALKLISSSEYWQRRDREFGFSAFLDGVIPELPPQARYLSELQDRALETLKSGETDED